MNIVVFNQNLKLNSLENIYDLIKPEPNEQVIFITTHFLFDNEKEFLNKLFKNSKYYTFSSFLTDEEMANIDNISFISKKMLYSDYLNNIKRNKNKIVINKVLSKFNARHKYILTDGLGIDEKEWKKAGFCHISAEYYYNNYTNNIKSKIKKNLKKIKLIKKIYYTFKNKNNYILTPEEVKVGYFEGHKYIFIGKMNRIDYRLSINFSSSPEDCEKINNGQFENKENCTYLTTWHEHSKCNIPDDSKYSVKWCQDGYLPPNYSHKDYFFKPDNVTYYCWDELGTNLFINQKLPYEIIPFRKKIYLPEPVFPSKIKNILIVASGSGDWTALKNRSDDDIMVDAIVRVAKEFPEIQFTYRCHPTWVHPDNVGVNSIKRVNEYFDWLKLPNLKISANIPIMKKGNEYQYSFSRKSLDEDLENADLVIGEHSISMIDAAFKKIPFFSVNLTNRRNFFVGINNLGFPTCSDVEEIKKMIKNINTIEFKKKFLNAIKNYNIMTDK